MCILGLGNSLCYPILPLIYTLSPQDPVENAPAGPSDLSVESEHLRESRAQQSDGFECVQSHDDNQGGPIRPMRFRFRV